MEQLTSLKIVICGIHDQDKLAREQVLSRWKDWAACRINLQVVFKFLPTPQPLYKKKHQTPAGHLYGPHGWNSLIAELSNNGLLETPAVLMAAADIHPGSSLFQTIQDLMDEDVQGWWFSVKPPPYYFHNILVKDRYQVKYFEMPHLFTIDEKKNMFFNHITDQHFLNAQDAPQILQNDDGVCFLNTQRFAKDNPMPYEFTDSDYLWFKNGCPR
jgi:hypothetical protein